MSFKVKIIIDEEEHNILQFSFDLSKNSDNNGRPTTKTVLHKLNLKLEANNKTDLMSWMLSPNQTKQIELHIQARQGEKTRILYFADAVLVGLETTFSATGNTPMTDDLQITAAGLNTNDSTTEYSAYWRTTFPQQEIETTVINHKEETLPNLKNYHFEDTDGNVIKKNDIKIGDIIYLVVNSENAIGENITINLDDDFKDYEYNGNPIANDILKDVLITDNICKVELKAIKQQN